MQGAIINVAVEWKFEITSDNFSLHLNVKKINNNNKHNYYAGLAV